MAVSAMKFSFSPALNFPWSGSEIRLLKVAGPVRASHFTSASDHAQARLTLSRYTRASRMCVSATSAGSAIRPTPEMRCVHENSDRYGRCGFGL